MLAVGNPLPACRDVSAVSQSLYVGGWTITVRYTTNHSCAHHPQIVMTVDKPCQLLGVGFCGTEGGLTVELEVRGNSA